MPTFTLFGQSVAIEAMPAATAQTCDDRAWLHQKYITVQLTAQLETIRVHTAGRSFPGREGSNEAGAWLLLGDFIQSSGALATSRSLPAANPRSMVAFTHASEAILAPGTVLNIGIASAKFGGTGGGFQAEYVGGPPIFFKALAGKHWHGATGRA